MTSCRNELTNDRVQQLLHYDQSTGSFSWRIDGRLAGCRSPLGYVLIGIDGALYLAHRLAWLYVTGRWPAKHVDHIDRNKANNCFANLREATALQNAANTGLRSTNRSGFKGVCWDGRNRKWRATITVNGRQRSLGRHEQLEDAVIAYAAEARAVHGVFAAIDLGLRREAA